MLPHIKAETLLKILISNDDGIDAKGLRVLAERLSRDKGNEVYVVAPDRERSATGHSLTLHKPLRIQEVEIAGVKAAWSTTGTPSDCVKLAVSELLGSPPDIVLSGINNGPNLGSEILYSGTVAAAMEGAFMDIPSIAVSHMYGPVRYFETAAEFISQLVQIFPKAHLSQRSLLNVNVPCLPIEEVEGVLMTELGLRLYDDKFEKRTDPRGHVYYWLTGEAIDSGEAESSDAWAILHNYITVTPIAFKMTDHVGLKKLQGVKELTSLLSKNGDRGENK